MLKVALVFLTLFNSIFAIDLSLAQQYFLWKCKVLGQNDCYTKTLSRNLDHIMKSCKSQMDCDPPKECIYLGYE